MIWNSGAWRSWTQSWLFTRNSGILDTTSAMDHVWSPAPCKMIDSTYGFWWEVCCIRKRCKTYEQWTSGWIFLFFFYRFFKTNFNRFLYWRWRAFFRPILASAWTIIKLINQPIFDGLYHPFVFLILGMVNMALVSPLMGSVGVISGLVNLEKAIEAMAIESSWIFPATKWVDLSIAMLNDQRVNKLLYDS